MADARILLIIGGGVAAYKSLELIRELKRRNVASRVIMTEGAKQFVTPMSAAALSGDKVYDALFSLTDEAEMGHIELSRSADLVLVCPATANLMAKAAAGLADDLASTALLATDKPVLMAPAMNVRMWTHAATVANRATLEARGVGFIDPDEGEMACGEFGPGRLAEVARIADAVEAGLGRARVLPPAIEGPRPLIGRKAVVTAGPTIEPLDPVRFISNHSSGRQGYAIAEQLARLGAEVTLVTGPTALEPPSTVKTRRVQTALEMLAAVEAELPADVFVGVAAVADWRPAESAAQKLKTDKAQVASLSLTENPDILRTVAGLKSNRPRLVVGFAAETHDVERHAREKLARKGCDWIVANDVSGGAMGGADNEVALVTRQGVDAWPKADKADIARRLAQRIAESLDAPRDERRAE